VKTEHARPNPGDRGFVVRHGLVEDDVLGAEFLGMADPGAGLGVQVAKAVRRRGVASVWVGRLGGARLADGSRHGGQPSVMESAYCRRAACKGRGIAGGDKEARALKRHLEGMDDPGALQEAGQRGRPLRDTPVSEKFHSLINGVSSAGPV